MSKNKREETIPLWVRDYGGKKGLQEIKVSASVFNEVMEDKIIQSLDSYRMKIPRKSIDSTIQADITYQKVLGNKVKEILSRNKKQPKYTSPTH